MVVLKYFLSHNLAHRAHAIVLIRHDHCIEGHEVGNWWQTSLTSGSSHRPVIYNVLKSSSALCPTLLWHCTKPTSLLILQSGRHYRPLYWFGSVWRMQISHWLGAGSLKHKSEYRAPAELLIALHILCLVSLNQSDCTEVSCRYLYPFDKKKRLGWTKRFAITLWNLVWHMNPTIVLHFIIGM